MLKKILLAFDGSENSLKAADYALIMAQHNNAEVEIIHVRESVTSYSTRVIYDAIEMEKELVSEAEEIMVQAIEKFKDTGITFTT
ncbi:MAG: universal stress protein, partial [Desulfitobacterium hafniense]